MAIIMAAVVSCKKDNSSSQAASSSLSGTWAFKYMTASTVYNAQYTDMGTQFLDVSTSDYTTTNNGGTVVFASGTATSTNITYGATAQVMLKSYENGMLVDTFVSPISWSIQPTSSVSKYQVIGSVSIYFPGGAFISSSSLPGGSSQTMASGYHFTITGDTLSMKSSIIKDTIEVISGITQTIQEKADFTVKLLRQ